jgi:hypothetical protein
MNKEFCIYEQALALKDLGFDEPVIAMYKEEFKKDLYPTKYWGKDNRNSMWIEGIISAPLYSQAFRWFREKHGLYPIIDSFVGVKGVIKFFYKLPMCDETFNTYEEAESACLDKLIEIVKNK